MATDPTAILAELIRCPSVTPEAGPALDVAERLLAGAGFSCERLVFQAEGTVPVDNLFARIGTQGPHLCFAGHVDVVPPGDVERWSAPPFAAEIRDGEIIGRGAEDMKGAVAAAIAAALDLIIEVGRPSGSLSFLLTGDEEGPSVNGTEPVLEWMAANGHTPGRLPGWRTHQRAGGRRCGEDRAARRVDRHSDGDRHSRPYRLSAKGGQSSARPDATAAVDFGAP